MSDPSPRITCMRFAAPRDSVEPIADLDRATTAMAAASADALRAVAEIERQGLWRRDGATSMTSWLAGRYGLAWGTAREWVRVVHALEGLPRIEDAYASGRLSWDQLRPLTRFVTAETEESWAERAARMRPSALWREARRHERIRAREAEEVRRHRFLRLDWDRERSVLWLEGMLPAEEGTTLQAALHVRAETVPAEPHAVDPGGARLADALLDLTTGGPEPATVVVHAGAEVLARESQLGAPGWLRPRADSAWPPRRSAAWPATAGSSGSWSRGIGRWGSAGGAGPSPASSSGCSGTGTEPPAGSPGASGSGGSTPTT
jgi:hypothetical protein